MLQVNVFLENISAERFWDIEKPLPQLQISTNLNLVGINKKQDEQLEVPFVFSINYNPAIAQISVKGKAFVRGSREEVSDIYDSYTQKKPPPPMIVQAVSNVAFLESILISRILNVPPPIPLPQVTPPAGAGEKKKGEPSYRT
ncbi:MAG: hypothetical protein ACQXXH_07465 [Candidatus Bathyarchaeia archaeon]|jgi:hypothetical protein|nr:hypothetical protein [Candidatus Bathyarchaeota archaeon A05DMB-4]MDH7595852.1 hypothetical protein [Candidatus Bathyarchaeota archaeon]